MKRFISTVAATALLTVGAGVTAGGAQAGESDDDFTRVALRPAVAKALTANDITATPINGAQAKAFRGTVALEFDITGTPGPVIRHSGGVVLKSHTGRLSLRRLWVNTNKGTVTALVNGSDRLKVFRLKAPSQRPKLGQLRLQLTPVAAGALNATFGTDFERKDTFGFASVISD